MNKFTPILLVFSLITGAVPVNAASVAPGTLVKGSQAAVYYVNADGKRLVFPTEGTYRTWYGDFSGVLTISDASLASIPLGGNVTYRPGSRMLKLTSAPTVYAVARTGVLRAISSEAVALSLYGSNWNKMVDDLSDSFFVNYKIGSPILSAADFVPSSEFSGVPNIGANSIFTAVTVPTASFIGPSDIAGRVMSIAVQPTNENVAYIGTASGGVYKTTDRGNSWKPTSDQFLSQHVSAITIDSRNPQTVYAGTGEIYTDAFGFEGVYVSRDGGSTWSTFAPKSAVTLNAVSSIVVDSADSNTVFVSGDNGIWKTVNAGVTWVKVADGFIQNMQASLLDHLTLFASGKGGLFLRTDNLGENWTNLQKVADNGLLKDTWFYRTTFTQTLGSSVVKTQSVIMYAAYADSFYLLRSDDGGKNWHEVGKQPFEGMRNYTIAADPVNADIIYTGGSTLHRATEGGYNAQEVNLQNFEVRALAFAPSNPKIVYLATDNGMEVSTDGGYGWSLKNTGLSATQWYGVAFGRDQNTLVGAVQDYSVLRSTSNGFSRLTSGEAREVVADSANADTFYALSTDKGVSRSIDGGNTFVGANGELPKATLNALTVDPVSGGTLYVGAGANLYWSNTAGAEWFSLGNGGSDSWVTAVSAEFSPRHAVFVGRANGSVYEVLGVGTNSPSWKLLWQHGTFQSIAGVKAVAGTVTVAVKGGNGTRVVRISEGANGWTTKDITSDMLGETWVRSMAINPTTPNTIYLGHYNGALVGTSQDGQTWHWDRVNALPSVEVTGFAFHPTGRTVLSTFGRGIYDLK